MPDWSTLGGGNRYEEGGADASDSGGTLLTASASTNTKGSYTQLIASTAFNASGLWVYIGRSPGFTGLSILIDIAIGTQVIIGNLGWGNKQNTFGYCFFPVFIPAGSQIQARCQSTTAIGNIDVSVVLGAKTFLNSSALGRVTTYGAATGDSGGTLASNGTNNIKGSYAELDGSIANPIKALILFSMASAVDTNVPSAQMLVDIAVGAATSEQVILPDVRFRLESGNDATIPAFMGPFPVNIPAGSRLSVREQKDDAGQDMDFIAYVVD